jgi:hypothetical protein
MDRVGPEKPQGGQLIRDVAIRYLRLLLHRDTCGLLLHLKVH